MSLGLGLKSGSVFESGSGSGSVSVSVFESGSESGSYDTDTSWGTYRAAVAAVPGADTARTGRAAAATATRPQT